MRPQDHFLRLMLTMTAAIALLALVWLSWDAYRDYRTARDQLPAIARMEAVRAEILYLDEALTMSARMAAASGNLDWEARYRRLEPQLDESIRQALQLVPEASRGVIAAKIDAANDALVAMEHRAFDLVSRGKMGEAQQLLASAPYEDSKKVYAAGMNEFNGQLLQARAAMRAELDGNLLRSAMTTVAASLMLMFGALLVLRAPRSMTSPAPRWPGKHTWSIGLIAAMSLAMAAMSANAADKPADLAAVLGELRTGGLVIYFRHAATESTDTGDEGEGLRNCATQRNLSAAGREQAAQIGKAFKALGIAVGTVTVGPLCRCKDTATLAFGRFAVSDDLDFAIGADARATRQFTQSLRRMLATPPAKATNAVIVSHSANLREATGLWPKPEGAAYVFRPLPEGGFAAIAMVLPEDWGKAAKLR